MFARTSSLISNPHQIDRFPKQISCVSIANLNSSYWPPDLRPRRRAPRERTSLQCRSHSICQLLHSWLTKNLLSVKAMLWLPGNAGRSMTIQDQYRIAESKDVDHDRWLWNTIAYIAWRRRWRAIRGKHDNLTYRAWQS